jgi:hypothetical protein
VRKKAEPEKAKRHPRPKTREEMLKQVAGVYKANGWDDREQAYHMGTLGITPPSGTDLFTDDELRTILDDFEKAKMILYSTKKGD